MQSTIAANHPWAALVANTLSSACLLATGKYEQVLAGTPAGRYLLGPHRPRKEGAEPPRIDRMHSLRAFFRRRVSLYVARGVSLEPPNEDADAECLRLGGPALADALTGWREEEDPECGYFAASNPLPMEVLAAPEAARRVLAGAGARGSTPSVLRLLGARCVAAALLGLYQRLALTGPPMS